MTRRQVEIHLSPPLESSAILTEDEVNRYNEVAAQVEQGKDPCIYCAKKDYLDVLKYYVEKEGADVDTQDDFGHTALMLACRKGYEQIARYLVSQGAVVNQADAKGNTALMYACIKRHEQIARYLVSQGADMNTKNIMGYTPLDMAKEKGFQLSVYTQLHRMGEVAAQVEQGTDPCIYCAKKDYLDVLRYYVENKDAVVNVQDNRGNTALIWACIKGHEPIARYLVEKGASVDMQDNFGYTALIYACIKRHEQIARYLVSQGADVKLQNNYGGTPLEIASEKGFQIQ